MSSTTPPSAESITVGQFNHILSLYPSTVEKAYRRNGRLRDDSKKNPNKLLSLSDALDDDTWRYDQLPGVLVARGVDPHGRGQWLDKDELERLVGWKITHGTHRPFLPRLIAQNAPEVVRSVTRSAFSIIPTSSSTSSSGDAENQEQDAYPHTALCCLTKALKGVGPATATLLLSVHSPDDVPFFSDELYAWLVHPGREAANLKLKYDLKEYRQLYERWMDFRKRLATAGGGITMEEDDDDDDDDDDGEGKRMRAVDVEKVAFVVGHWDLLGKDDRQSIVAVGKRGPEAPKVGEEQAANVERGKGGADDVDRDTGGVGVGVGVDHDDVEKEKERGKARQTVAEKRRPDKRTAGGGGLARKDGTAANGERRLADEDVGNRRSKRLKS